MATLDTAAEAEATVLEGATSWKLISRRPRLMPRPSMTAIGTSMQSTRLSYDEDGLLEMRPIFVRKARRTRAHVLVTMLALKVVREMRRALIAAFGTTDDDKMAVTVEDALLALARLVC